MTKSSPQPNRAPQLGDLTTAWGKLHLSDTYNCGCLSYMILRGVLLSIGKTSL